MSFSEQESSNRPPTFRRGSRITPRTCLWPLAGSLVVTFCLSIGLTFRSDRHCYAGTCGEWLFPLQARIHVVIWYSWILLSVVFLAVRAFHPEIQHILARTLTKGKLPVIRKHLTISGVLVVSWVVLLYGVVIGVWWVRLSNYFVDRGRSGGIEKGGNRLAAVALTGHICDITMGMVLIPISRHSALASFFRLSVSTTLTNHMLSAYVLFALVVTHGLFYLSWVPVFKSLSTNTRRVIPVLNPTYLYHETWPGNSSSLGIWRASLIFTGIFAATIMSAIFVTTLPAIRRKHFNLFYFTHLLAIPMVIIICLHASTMLYCTAPGLAMWILDWGMRLYELRRVLPGEITTIGKEWYCITAPLPRQRLTGCSCRSPLAHFYIHHAGSSYRELHPFTTITHLATQNATTPTTQNEFPLQFLFQKRGRVSNHIRPPPDLSSRFAAFSKVFRINKQRAKGTQSTDRLAELVDQQCSFPTSPTTQPNPATIPSSPPASPHPNPYPSVSVPLRLEGPYFSPSDPSRYHTVICLVAGTGISGAITIASAFAELQRSRTASNQPASCCGPNCGPPPTTDTTVRWERCVIVWTVREADHVALPFLQDSQNAAAGLELQTHLTGGGRARMSMDAVLASIRKEDTKGKVYVYISGPKPFVDAGSKACKAAGGGGFLCCELGDLNAGLCSELGFQSVATITSK